MPDVIELDAEVAYEAAKTRALKTTEALILAEGQILTLQRTVRDLGEENTRISTELDKLKRDQEVTHDATTVPDEAYAGAETGSPHPFSD